MTDVEKLHLIESYHLGTLTPAEQEQVDALLQADPEFAQELQDYELLLDGFAGLELDHFEAQLQQWEQHSKAKEQASQSTETPVVSLSERQRGGGFFSLRRLTAVAAVVAGLLFVPIGYNYFTSSPDLVAEFLSVSDAPSGLRSLQADKDAQKQLKEDGYKAFNAKKYDEAVKLLTQYTQQYTPEHEVIFFLGAAKLENNDAEGAARDLDQAIQPLHGIYSPEAEWLLALAQLKLNNTDACKQLLQAITAREYHDFKDRAQQLLDRLK